jgi:cell division septation protein DedD
VLRGKGFTAYETSGGSGAALRYRVRVGPLADRTSADGMVVKLRSAGYTAAPVAPGR